MPIDSFTPTADPRWTLVVEGFDKGLERSVESVMALVNGYSGTRAAVEEGSGVSHPSTFVAGVFNQPDKPQDNALEAPIPEIVVAPNWSKLGIAVENADLTIESAELLEQRRMLDLRQGVLLREWRLKDAEGRITRLSSLRFASLADRHALLQIVTLLPENYSGQVGIASVVDGWVHNENNTVHLKPVSATALSDGAQLIVQTTEGKYSLVFAANATLQDDGGAPISGEVANGDAVVGTRFSFRAQQGQTYTLAKYVALYTSRDGEHPEEAAQSKLSELVATGAATLLERHTAAWAERWRDCDIEISGDEDVQREVRWAIYHLAGSAWYGDEHSSVGARSITGERYRGHVFWDTETFVWPFHCYTDPATARSLLMYRYNTLGGARNKAKKQGYNGALFAWESTDEGEETTPPWIRLPNGVRQQILTGEQEHHLAADIAYAILQYRQASRDDEFFLQYGAEMLLDIARFWASRAVLGDDEHYHIHTVIGPDEYHEYTDDGAYTNVMAQWTIRRALEAADELKNGHPEAWHAVVQKLGLNESELADWRQVADNMTVLFDPETGLFEQFKGYHGLEEVDLTGHDMSIETMDIALGWEHLQKTKVLKQADVVMLIFLLWDQFDEKVHATNFHYYEPRTSHDSSLSASFHALVAARLGDLEMAERYLRKAALIDLDFTRKGWAGATGGVHIAALGGIWQALVFGFLGMRPQNDGLRFLPHIPPSWGEVRMNLVYHGAHLTISGKVDGSLAVQHESGIPLNIAVGDGEWRTLNAGENMVG